MQKQALTPEKEDDCLARSEARRLGSIKALATLYGVSGATVKRAIARARRRKGKPG